MIQAIKSVLFSALMLPVLAVNAATISGTITNRSSGDPIQGARVILGSTADSDTTSTNAQGAYTFTGVSTGFHSVVATMTGYQPSTANVNALQQNGSYTANISLVSSTGGGPAGLISGTVKDSTTKEAIKSATVILSHPAGRGGATPIDTVLTDGEGRYAFAAVPVSNNYIVAVSASGYASLSNSNVDVAGNDTISANFLLVKLPTPSASVTGTVTDLASKETISGVKVLLRQRVLANGIQIWQGVDSADTKGDGAYGFDSLAAGTYSILASKADFISKTTANFALTNTGKDTIDITLTKIARGAMSIFVGLDSTGNAALAGAAVAASSSSPDGEVYTGTTDAKGWVVFPSVVAGSYSVSANLSGFVSKIVTRAVAADEKDTGYVYLARATAQNSKSLSGLVRDADGKPVSGAKVIFTATGINGIVLFANSSSTGDYSFNGIPATVSAGSVDIQKSGFTDFSGNVTLSGAASFLNVTLKLPVSIANRAIGGDKLRVVRGGKGVSLEFSASNQAGSLFLFDIRGSIIESVRVPAGAVRADLSAAARTGASILVLKQGAVSRKLVLSPAR
jgi:hypothetical protein